MSRPTFAHQRIRASAGSGKTHQLTNRYLVLVAAGVEPEAILATTFTRKAAGEILDRVLWRLAEAAGDARKAKQLAADINAEKHTQQEAVALLRRMLQNLHRLRISTLDSFYIAMAGSFSLELGLPAGWSIGEVDEDAALRREALERMLARADADILAALYQRLTRGETKRSVDGELLDIVEALYSIHQETAPDVWQKIAVPPRLLPAELEDLLARIDAFDLANHTGLQKPRADDLERVRQEAWKDLLGKGLCGKVFSGENAFRSKPLPEELVGLYRKLLEHVRSSLIQPIAEQTWATREFLDGFHDELWALKQISGALRFDEVTQALVNALGRQALPAAGLAFRLDGAVEHLLLDEFQDTSLAQWRVLEPLARSITQGPLTPLPSGERGRGEGRSFFCVGDVKQAIYAWRGGITEIFNNLPKFLGKLVESPLEESRRSAPPIIEAVNTIFTGAPKFAASDKCQGGLQVWCELFRRHSTVRKEEPGYVCLHTGPAQNKDQSLAQHRVQHIKYVAQQIRDLCQAAPGRSIGVLCRKNDTIARTIYELRLLEVQASEEGGNPLTDSPAVELILSLFTLADHPGHSVAWFHLKTSPLEEALRPFHDTDQLAGHLRREILAAGYGRFTRDWAKRLAFNCDQRDLSRLQQLVEMAYDFQPRSSLRADDFVRWVRQQRVPAPSSASVRVMTMHTAKGLEFDAVVLPELDSELIGRTPPSFVVDRDPESLTVNFVCRYADATVQQLLTPNERRAFDQYRQLRVAESLSLLYVALTRARHGLYLYIPGPREGRSNPKDAWYNLLRQTLAPDKSWTEDTVLYEQGDAKWHAKTASPAAADALPPDLPNSIAFQSPEKKRRRGLEHVAPSSREGQARVPLDRLFHPSEGTGMAAGTLYHAWFETIAWLDDGDPTDAVLRAVANKLRQDLPAETWRNLDKLLAQFRTWLRNPAISDILRRSAYADPKQPGFPAKLAPFWTKTLASQKVERERRFLVCDDQKFWNGSLDRIVWLSDGDRLVAADVIDFKTDNIESGNEKALAERSEHYQPQLNAYRQAVSRFAHLPVERIAARLVFAFAERVIDV